MNLRNNDLTHCNPIQDGAPLKNAIIMQNCDVSRRSYAFGNTTSRCEEHPSAQGVHDEMDARNAGRRMSDRVFLAARELSTRARGEISRGPTAESESPHDGEQRRRHGEETRQRHWTHTTAALDGRRASWTCRRREARHVLWEASGTTGCASWRHRGRAGWCGRGRRRESGWRSWGRRRRRRPRRSTCSPWWKKERRDRESGGARAEGKMSKKEMRMRGGRAVSALRRWRWLGEQIR